QIHYEQSKENLKANPAKALLRNTIEIAMHTSSDETAFKRQLLEQGINTVVRRNGEGRVYGMTFIDHTSKTVWNGSQLGKHLSANVFHDWWNNGTKPQATSNRPTATSRQEGHAKEEVGQPHDLFNFLDKGQAPYTEESGVIEALGGLLPETQGED